MLRTAVALATAAWFVVVLELCARTDDVLSWGAPFWGEYSQDQLVVGDDLGVRCRPGGRFEKWQLNSHGFRGPEVRLAKRPGVTRVLVLGASETFGLFESPDREYPAELRRRLERARPGRFEVINAACAGMTPPRIDQLLASYLGRFQPDVVLFYPSPQFYLDDEPPRETHGGQKRPDPRFSPRLARRAKTWLKTLLPAGTQTRLRDIEIERRVRAHGPDWLWTTPPQDRMELFQAHLRSLIDTAKRLGGRPVLLTHANRFGARFAEADREQLVALRKFFPRAKLETIPPFERAMNDAVLRTAEETDVPVIDIERRLGKDPSLFADFSHFTDRGAQAMAEVLTAELLALTEKKAKAGE